MVDSISLHINKRADFILVISDSFIYFNNFSN